MRRVQHNTAPLPVTRELIDLAERRTAFLFGEVHMMTLRQLLANAWMQGVLDGGETILEHRARAGDETADAANPPAPPFPPHAPPACKEPSP